MHKPALEFLIAHTRRTNPPPPTTIPNLTPSHEHHTTYLFITYNQCQNTHPRIMANDSSLPKYEAPGTTVTVSLPALIRSGSTWSRVGKGPCGGGGGGRVKPSLTVNCEWLDSHNCHNVKAERGSRSYRLFRPPATVSCPLWNYVVNQTLE